MTSVHRLAALVAAAAASAAFAQTSCKPMETRDANGASVRQKPAFAGQTRVCEAKSDVAFDVTVVAKGLDHPWAVEPLPGGDLLVTERAGRLRLVTSRGDVSPPIEGLPKIDAGGQGGLLDVALSPKYDSDRRIYWSFTEPRQGGNGTSVATGTLSQDFKRVDNAKVIFQALPTYNNKMHFGSRLAFGPDGMLYITTGERSDSRMRRFAQQLDSHLGKTMRVKPEGGAAEGNPFTGRAGALPEIWSLGHRNIQAAAFDARGQYWIVEHGTRGGDELNLVQKGKNYGWPLQAYGIEYSGSPIEGSQPQREGYEQPVYYWDPVIAPSGAQFYSGKAFPAWKGNLFVGALGQKRLVRLVIEGDKVVGEEHLLADRGQRVRDVREGPDGALYIVTDEGNGEVWRVAPRR